MKRKVKVLIKCPLGDIGEEFKFDTSGVWINGYTGYLGKHHIEKWIEDGWLELIEELETIEDIFNDYSGRLIISTKNPDDYVKNEQIAKDLSDLAKDRVLKAVDSVVEETNFTNQTQNLFIVKIYNAIKEL